MSEAQNTGQFAKVIVTKVGKEMIAKSQGGQTLTFTRVALGDGLVERDEDPVNYTKIKNERLSANIAKYTDRGNGQFELQFRVSNQEVETGFWHREIGVMAKIDNGEEQLYAYTTSGNQASFLYDKTTPIEERIINIAFVIGNAQNVQVIVNSSIIYVTLEDMEEAIEKHNTSPDSHIEAFDKHNSNTDSHKPAFDKHNNNKDSHAEAFKKHNADVNAHKTLFDKKLDKTGGTLTGDLNASGHNITATKFIGVLQGIADTATKATQDKNGLQIDTNYLKLAGGSMQGLLNLFANSTIPTPEEKDNSKKITNTEWVQAWVKSFVSKLSENIEVETQEDGHFSCPALGITGLMAQNGYICLGKLFGNLILQWGKGIFRDEKEKIMELNIAFNSGYIALATDVGGGCYRLGITPENKNNLHVWVAPQNSEPVVHGVDFYWIAIGA